jgi:hypothetical protein
MPSDGLQLKTDQNNGELGNLTKSSSVTSLSDIGPISLPHPLLNPGLTILTSS